MEELKRTALYSWHVENAIPCESWFDDMEDSELLELIPFLIDLSKVDAGMMKVKAQGMRAVMLYIIHKPIFRNDQTPLLTLIY